jgi:uncharacterized protein
MSTTNKRELVRVVRQPEGSVIADPTGKANGRGAYVHSDPSCWELALAKGKLDRALKTSVSSDDLRALRQFAGLEVSA